MSAKARRPRSLGEITKPYVRHARQFGDPRSVYETAEQDPDLSAKALGYLAAMLRRTKAIQENDHYVAGRGTRNEVRRAWPKFQLTTDERDRLAWRLLDEETAHKQIAAYVGTSVRWVREFEAEHQGDSWQQALLRRIASQEAEVKCLSDRIDRARFERVPGSVGEIVEMEALIDERDRTSRQIEPMRQHVRGERPEVENDPKAAALLDEHAPV